MRSFAFTLLFTSFLGFACGGSETINPNPPDKQPPVVPIEPTCNCNSNETCQAGACVPNSVEPMTVDCQNRMWLANTAICEDEGGVEYIVNAQVHAMIDTCQVIGPTLFTRNVPPDRDPTEADGIVLQPDQLGYTVYVDDQGIKTQLNCAL